MHDKKQPTLMDINHQFKAEWEHQTGSIMLKTESVSHEWKKTIASHFYQAGVIAVKELNFEKYLLDNKSDLQSQVIHSSEVITLLKEENAKHTTEITKLKRALKYEQKTTDAIATEKVNGYHVTKMLGDIKDLSIKYGGYQNAYALSHVIAIIFKARECQKLRRL